MRAQGLWHRSARKRLLEWAGAHPGKLLISEGQAEPWEAITTPPNPTNQAMYSCLPEQVIQNYNACMDSYGAIGLYAYLFWGAEYWVLRNKSHDSSYLDVFACILEHAG